jgi:ubiquinone/menaquinone biosynthesis C-methylase UbiE
MSEICDYTNFDYKKEFWGKYNRGYEDLSEKIALRKLLPFPGESFIDLGCGFGRFIEEYADKFDEITLFDYAPSLLEQAKEKGKRLGLSKIKFVLGDLYDLPFSSEAFDSAMLVRVLHHIENVEKVFCEVHRILKKDGTFILEFANKRNLLEIARFFLRRKNLRPFDYEPSNRAELYFNFHPQYIKDKLKRAGFIIEEQISVSNFRAPFIKNILNAQFLVNAEIKLEKFLNYLQLSPSVFVKANKNAKTDRH